MNLAGVVHHEEASRLEVDMQRPPRRLLCADGHPARGSKREQRDGKAFADLVEMVVVRRDAVATVAVEVQADAVEGNAEAVTDAIGRIDDYRRRGVGRRIEAEVAE